MLLAAEAGQAVLLSRAEPREQEAVAVCLPAVPVAGRRSDLMHPELQELQWLLPAEAVSPGLHPCRTNACRHGRAL